MPTSSQTLKGSISELFQSVSNGKTLIASAITDKGISTSNTDTFETMAINIRNLSNIDGAIISINGTKYQLSIDNVQSFRLKRSRSILQCSR